MKFDKGNFNAKYHFYLEQGMSHRDALVESLKVHSLWGSVSSVEAIPGWGEEMYIVEVYYSSRTYGWYGSSPNDGGTEFYPSWAEACEDLVNFGMYRIG